jgi:hypothetical protein
VSDSDVRVAISLTAWPIGVHDAPLGVALVSAVLIDE